MCTLGDPELADCILVVGEEEKEIYASRAILAKACGYFKTMFTSRMAESKMTDDLTGGLNKIYFPEENPAIFTLMLRLLYGEVTELPSDMKADEFVVVADKARMWLLTSGPVIDACMELLQSKLRTPDFVPFLLAYRGPDKDRPLSIDVHRGIMEWARGDGSVSDLFTPAFRDECTKEDLTSLARAMCQREGFGHYAVSLQFVRDFMIPAVQRIAKIESKDPFGELDKALAKPSFGHVARVSVSMTVKQLTRLRFKALGSSQCLTSPPHAKMWWESDEDSDGDIKEEGAADDDLGCRARLVMEINLLSPVHFASMSNRSIRDQEDIPKQFVSFVVDRRRNFMELYSRISMKEAATPVVTYYGKARAYHCQTLLHYFMMKNASEMSFKGMTQTIFVMLGDSDWWKHLDEKLTATELVQRAGRALCTRKSDPLPDVAREFLQSMPWNWVGGATLMKCTESPVAHTGMSKADWAKILMAVLDSTHEWTRPHLNYTGNQTPPSTQQIAEALAGRLREQRVKIRQLEAAERKQKEQAPAAGKEEKQSTHTVPMEEGSSSGKEEKKNNKRKAESLDDNKSSSASNKRARTA